MTVASGPIAKWRGIPTSKYTKTSPNLLLIDAFLNRQWGFFFNGGRVVRTVRGGDSPSIHSWGAAVDSSWRKTTRAKSLEAIEWILANSKELHVDEIHDYKANGRVWKSDRQSWKDNPTMPGANSGDWIHYQTTIEGWADTTPLAARPGLVLPSGSSVPSRPTVDFPVFEPENCKFSLWPLSQSKPLLFVGMPFSAEAHDATRYLQGGFRCAGFDVKVDGDYGAATESIVKFFQQHDGLVVDGRVGRESWAKFDAAVLKGVEQNLQVQ